MVMLPTMSFTVKEFADSFGKAQRLVPIAECAQHAQSAPIVAVADIERR